MHPLIEPAGDVPAGQLVHQMETQGFVSVDLLHLRVIEGQREILMVTNPPKVAHHLRGLVDVKSEIMCSPR